MGIRGEHVVFTKGGQTESQTMDRKNADEIQVTDPANYKQRNLLVPLEDYLLGITLVEEGLKEANRVNNSIPMIRIPLNKINGNGSLALRDAIATKYIEAGWVIVHHKLLSEREEIEFTLYDEYGKEPEEIINYHQVYMPIDSINKSVDDICYTSLNRYSNTKPPFIIVNK